MKLFDLIVEIKYTDDYVKSIIKKYEDEGKSYNDFFKNEKRLWDALYSKNPDNLQILTKNLFRQVKKSYTDDELRSIAKTHNLRKDFKIKNSGAYMLAKKRGPFVDGKNTLSFFNDITSHMKRVGDLYKRMVYVYEFYNQNDEPVGVYVGLTSSEERRKTEHLKNSKTESSVKKFILAHPELKYKYFMVSDGYINAEDAINMECDYVEKYKIEGKWIILNKSKCGSLGSGKESEWNDEDKIRKIASDYDNLNKFRINNPGLYSYLNKKNNRPLRDELTKGMYRKNKPFADEEEIRRVASKYSVLSDFLNKEPSIATSARVKGIYSDVVKHMVSKRQRITDDEIFDIALKNDSYLNFKNNNKNAYVAAQRRDLLNVIRNLFKDREQSQINENRLSFKNILKYI